MSKSSWEGSQGAIAAAEAKTPISKVTPRSRLLDVLQKIYNVITKKQENRREVFAKILNTEVKSLGFSYFSFPVYRMVPVVVECHEWASQYKHYLSNYDEYDGEELFPYTTKVEVSPKVSKMLPIGFYYQITLPDDELVIVGAHHEGQWNYNLDVFAKTQAQSDKILEEILNRITTRNIYKNQRISLTGSTVSFVSDPPVSFDEVVLPLKTLEVFKNNTIDIFTNAEKLKGLGFPLKRGILLEGEPGVGKTKLFKALSSYGIGKFTSIFVGSRRFEEDFITHMFQCARDLTPAVIFLEDLDMWGSSREGLSGQILGNLLKELDGIEENDGVLVCGSTNNLEVIDKALKDRPSRFDVTLHVSLLEVPERANLLEQLFTTRLKIGRDKINFNLIAVNLDLCTGAEVQEFVFCVAQEFLDRLEDLTTEDCVNIISEKKTLNKKVGFQR